MPDAKYDAVIAGGGHQATIIACYLQRAGLKTAMFDRWNEMGGGACSEELPLPGFIQNPCAHFVRFYAHPAYQDFHLRDYGLVHFFPEHDEAWIFPDGRYILGDAVWEVKDFYTGKSEFSHERAQKLVNEIGKFSKNDAAFAGEWIRKYRDKIKSTYAVYRFTGPEAWGEKDPLEELYDDPKNGLDPRWKGMTVGELAYDIFESPEMRTFFLRAFPTSNGLLPEDVAAPYWLIHVLGLTLSLEPAAIIQGGTHSITHALLRAFQAYGGEFFVLSEVERILVEDGVAKGIRLRDGTEIGADIVISDLSLNLTFDLLGKENVPKELWTKVQELKEKAYERTQILWGNIALYEPPEYSAGSELGLVPRLYVGEADPDYFVSGKFKKERWEKGIANKTYLLIGPDSMWDNSRAPKGRFTAAIEEFTCPWKNFSELEWLRIKREMADVMLKEWQRYAPNVTKDNFIEAFISTPDDVINRNPTLHGGGWGGLDHTADHLGRLRPIPELSNYRLPVKNAYLCSSAAHSGAGIGRGSSYCCYKTIAKDYNLSYKPWEEAGRPI
jgi:beta-carotene ketolase (CrtO type)